MYYCRMVFRGRGALGPRSVPWLQQTYPAGPEHDTEGRRTIRPCLRPAHQCRMYTNYLLKRIKSVIHHPHSQHVSTINPMLPGYYKLRPRHYAFAFQYQSHLGVTDALLDAVNPTGC